MAKESVFDRVRKFFGIDAEKRNEPKVVCNVCMENFSRHMRCIHFSCYLMIKEQGYRDVKAPLD